MTENTTVRVIPEKDIDLRVAKENVLGNGAFGIVIKTSYAGTPVAAKTLHMFTNPVMYGLFPDTPEYENIIEEFQREFNTTAKLSHPNIIQLIGVVNDSVQNTPKWMIQELGDTTLEKQLQTNPMLKQQQQLNNNNNSENNNTVQSLKAKLEIMRDILRGLSFMHQNNIAHRDIKPANIIKINNTYKLADLGIAKILQENNNQQYLRTAIGTPLYVAPEVVMNSRYTLKCDIYSIGVMLIEVILNEAPNLQTRNNQLQRAVAYIHDIISSVPQPQPQQPRDGNNNSIMYEKSWLENFLRSLIANDFNDRPTALETLSFIERLANYLPIQTISVDNNTNTNNNNTTITALESHFQKLEIKMNDLENGIQKINQFTQDLATKMQTMDLEFNTKLQRMEINISNILQLLESQLKLIIPDLQSQQSIVQSHPQPQPPLPTIQPIQVQPSVPSKCQKCDGTGKYHPRGYMEGGMMWKCCFAIGSLAAGCENCTKCGGTGTLGK